jgi:hypothetical protein
MGDADIEHAAQLIYAVVHRFRTDGKTMPWVDGGNSLVQEDCRRAAQRIVERHRVDASAPPAREPVAWRIDALPPHTWVQFTDDAAVANANRVAGWPVTPLFVVAPHSRAGLELLEKERDMCMGWYEKDIGKLTPTPPRRLREYKGVTYAPNGKWYDTAACLYFASAAELIVKRKGFTDADHAALLALRDDLWEPVETLEAVLEDWANATRDGVHSVELSDLEHRLRAWLNTPSDAKNVGAALADSEKQPVSIPYTLPITPEQAVGVLVAHGASIHKLAHAPHFYRQDTDILVLPTATPEGK